jgi:hypothetical protein
MAAAELLLVAAPSEELLVEEVPPTEPPVELAGVAVGPAEDEEVEVDVAVPASPDELLVLCCARAAWSANRPRLAAPAATTTAIATRARPRTVFMAQPCRPGFSLSCGTSWK